MPGLVRPCSVHSLRHMLPAPLIDLLPSPQVAMPEVCKETDSLTCALVHDWTGNDRLAQASAWLIGKPLAILAIVLLALLARWLLNRVIDRVVSRAGDPHESAHRRAQRAHTMGSMLQSVVAIVIFVVTLFMIISELGYDIAPLIASAGIVGVALGFGAQSLVKDYLSGMFMTFEDQYGVGDTITVNEVTGRVEAVSLRVTRLRDGEGIVWYVRNGEVLKVGNRSKGGAAGTRPAATMNP